MDTKLSGYLLLISGVLIIGFALVNVYLVFTGRLPSIQLFSQSGISLDLAKFLGPSLNPSLSLATSSSSGQLEILSADSLNKLFNLTFHLVLMGFVSASGFRLATLGNLLLRPIEVSLRAIDTEKVKIIEPKS